MKYRSIMFDLDGTLLPLDQNVFIAKYFELMSLWMSRYGYDREGIVKATWQGTAKMIMNDGSFTNEKVFWDNMISIYGKAVLDDLPYFDAFYRQKFDEVKEVVGYSERSAELINKLKNEGVKIILATNPVFPRIATEKRIAWAGLLPEDFDLITTYENSYHSKPNIEYYKDIIKQTDISPETCLMVGNDVDEDMIAAELGIDVFLLTDSLLNKSGKDISVYNRGSMNDLFKFLNI